MELAKTLSEFVDLFFMIWMILFVTGVNDSRYFYSATTFYHACNMLGCAVIILINKQSSSELSTTIAVSAFCGFGWYFLWGGRIAMEETYG